MNALMPAALCPQSRQPELKHAAVRLEPAPLPWRIVAAAWLPEGQALALQQALRAQFVDHAYASLVPFGREPEGRVGLLFRAARAVAPDVADLAAVLAPLLQALDLHRPGVLRYADPRAGQTRAMRLGEDGRLQAFLLAGDVAAQRWVTDLLKDGLPAAPFGRALLASRAQAPGPVTPRSPQVCACFDVSQAQITDTLASCEGTSGERLAKLQQTLRCGTQCGSCLPALREMVRQHPAVIPIVTAAMPSAPTPATLAEGSS